jgi:aldehyde:ferredoxin oxidoreductase
MSPATLSYGESDIGGTWGVGLKRAGFDGVVIKGRSTTPVYLALFPDEIRIERPLLLGEILLRPVQPLKTGGGKR